MVQSTALSGIGMSIDDPCQCSPDTTQTSQTCVVRSGSMPSREVSAPRVPFSQVQSVSGIETESGSGMVFAGHHKYRYWNRACIVFIQQSRRGWLACLKPTPPHHSNLIWGKPSLEKLLGEYMMHPAAHLAALEGTDTHAIFPLGSTDNLNRVVL